MNEHASETLAIQCLGWLAGEAELLPVFMGASGASEADLRARADEREFLMSVLEFVTMDDAWVIRCCDAIAAPYEAPMTALAVLQGQARRHWT